MKLKIGTVAKLTGFSPSGVRYLESRGVASPSGGRKGTYRMYTLDDVARLLECRNYRECGFDIEETAELFHAEGATGVAEKLKERAGSLRDEIAFLENLEAFIEDRAKDTQSIDAGREPVIMSSPSLYWAPLWIPEEKTSSAYPIPNGNDGFDIPFADSSVIIEGGVQNPTGVHIGYAMMRRFAARVPDAPGSRFVPASKAVKAIIRMGREFQPNCEDLARVAAFIEENGLVAKGDAHTQRLCTIHVPSEVRYDVLWQPVSE